MTIPSELSLGPTDPDHDGWFWVLLATYYARQQGGAFFPHVLYFAYHLIQATQYATGQVQKVYMRINPDVPSLRYVERHYGACSDRDRQHLDGAVKGSVKLCYRLGKF